VEECIGKLRNAGIVDINFDLIYGLPLQSVDSVLDNMDKAVQLNPDRIALFGYAHVPWARGHQKQLEKYEMPDAFERFEMAEKARERLVEKGYKAIGIDHFAKEDDELWKAYANRSLYRNFQGYTDDGEKNLIGFGVSSISSFGNAYVQKDTVIKKYKENVSAGKFPVVRGLRLSREDEFRARIIEELMCYFEVDVAKVKENFDGADGFDVSDALDMVSGLEKDGLAVRDGDSVKITEKGRPFARVVASCFDQYLEPDDNVQRHARAV
jgi:oxygen-independent coproporphyrinogen-3 oxidase